MATIKKNKKKKTIIIVCVVLAVVIAVTAGVLIAQKNKKTEVTLSTISTSDINETVSATGKVTAGSTKEYKVGTVATVKEVFVKTGDQVKEGDKLATFDTSTLDGEVKKLQSTYNSAKAGYNESVAAQKQAKANVAAVEKQIEALEKQLGAVSHTTTTTTRRHTTTTTTTRPSTSRETITIPPTTTQPTVSYPATFDGLVAALTDLVNTINNVASDVSSTNQLINIVLNVIIQEIENGNLSADAIAEKVGAAVRQAIQDGIVEVVESGAAADMIEAAVRAVDWSKVAAEIANSGSVKSATLEVQIAALTAQKEIYAAQSSSSIVSAKKEVMDSAKSALDAVKESSETLAAGWVATFDGTITSCDLTPGEVTSALTAGITLENMDSMVVTVSLNEYDVQKVKVGMAATITTAYGKYSGEVVSKAPTATGGDSGSILDSVGSMAGISGLSSLTASGAGVEVQVRVDNPDEYIIVGFDADVEVGVGDHNGVVVVPIESIVLEKTGTYVYLYNEEEKSVTKTQITTGAVSDTYYEVTSGLNVGDQIVATPSSDYKEETFDVKVAK